MATYNIPQEPYMFQLFWDKYKFRPDRILETYKAEYAKGDIIRMTEGRPILGERPTGRELVFEVIDIHRNMAALQNV